MSTLRIVDAPLLPNVDGTEKIPTGGRGDYTISVDQIKDHIFQDIGKELVGLGNVDNTSDLDKPVSTAQQAALNLKADKTYVDLNLDLKADKTNVYTRSETTLALSQKADLVNGVVPSNQLPSYVDDVVEYTTSTLPIIGESGKIYVTTDTNRTWRWSGNQYVEISNGGISDSTLKLQTPRKIANVDFDGTQNIDLPHNNLKDRDAVEAHPTSAISYGAIDQERYNNGLESIVAMLAITNPINGMRVYVKSYHVGLGKGGRDFVYDESKSTINDGVMVFNGWVSQTNPSVIDAFEAGCAGIGDHSSYLDHEGMRRIAKYITDQYSLGNKKFTVKFSVGDYVCQKEGIVTSEFRTFAENSFKLTNMPDLELTLDFDNANFITRSGMRVGSFNRSDMSKYTGAAPFFGNASTVFFTPDHPFSIVNIKSLTVLGNSAHNGNISNHIVGGVYGDTGIQWASIGFYATQIDEMTFDGIHVSHSHSNDGWYLAGRNPTATKDDLSDGRFMSIRGLVATNNGRNGISFTGGKNSDWYSCYSFNNGLSNHPTRSNPRSNIDIEAEVSPIRRARFYNFKSHFAGMDGLVSDIQDSRDVVFYDSEFINTTRSLWVNRPQFKFYNCYISGKIISGYAAATENDRTKFVECAFDNDTLRNPNVDQTGYLFTFSGRNPLFKDCTVNLYGGRLAWAANAAIGSTSFKGLTLNVYGIQQDPVFGEFEYEDVVINDLRVDPSVSIVFSVGSSSVKNMRIVCETRQSGIAISGNYNFTKTPQSERGFVKYFADTLTYSRQTAPLEIVPKFNTTAGYYNANNWAASTVYAINSFINANNKVYKCTVAGTSGTVAPSHSSGTAADGSVTWEYIGSLAVFTSYT